MVNDLGESAAVEGDRHGQGRLVDTDGGVAGEEAETHADISGGAATGFVHACLPCKWVNKKGSIRLLIDKVSMFMLPNCLEQELKRKMERTKKWHTHRMKGNEEFRDGARSNCGDVSAHH